MATALRQPAACRHCGLPVPGARARRDDPFCCAGCEVVYGLLHAEGLERYYALRSARGAPPALRATRGFGWLDAELAAGAAGAAAGAAAAGEAPSSGARRHALDVQGIQCAACVWLLQTLYRRHPGGVDLRVNPALGKAELLWDHARGDLRAWLADAERFGYRFGPDRKSEGRASRGLLIRFGLCAAAAMNAMILGYCYYAGLSPRDGALYTILGHAGLALAGFTVVVGGWVFARGVWNGLRRGMAHLDLPITLGMLLAFAGSVAAWRARGPEAAYFDTVAAFVALMLLGRWLQERVLERNRHALLASAGTADLYVRRYAQGRLASVPAEDLRRGDEIWVVPGELVPLEGELLDESDGGGEATLSLDWITGESEARRFVPGERAPAGSFNAGSRTARFAATEDFRDSRLHQLLATSVRDPGALGESAEGRWWRRVGAVYVTAVLALAAAAFLLWWPLGGADRALQVTVAVLVVTCPCALGLAGPMAHEMANLALRRRGVYVREGSFFQRAAAVRKVLFDKTGTLTAGAPAPRAEAARTVAALAPADRGAFLDMASRSNHPLSRAAAGLAAGAAISPEARVVETPGGGLTMRRGGRCYRLGSRAFAAGETPGAGEEERGEATLFFTRDGVTLAALAFDEALRPDAVEEVRRLEAGGLEVHLVSGDRPARARRVAECLGIAPQRVSAGLSPEAKAVLVRSLDRGDTLMVGDGLNDAPALAAAFAAATPAVEHASIPARADFYFLGEGIAAVRRALAAAAQLRRALRQNLAFAAAYNAAALALCFAGVVTPLAAALLMPASSISLVLWTRWRFSEGRLPWMS